MIEGQTKNIFNFSSYKHCMVLLQYSSVRDNQFGMSNFNWKVGRSNYQILRTGCYPYIKYHCSRKQAENLVTSDRFMRFIKIVNLGKKSAGLTVHYCTYHGLHKHITFLVSGSFVSLLQNKNSQEDTMTYQVDYARRVIGR